MRISDWSSDVCSSDLPKLLGYFTLFGDSRRLVAHGGAVRAFVSVVLESLMSILLAPILMLFQSGFVISILAGRTVRWAPQPRADEETSWREALAAPWEIGRATCRERVCEAV